MGRLIIILSISFLSLSCEDVVQIDVPRDEPRLIVDGIIKIDEDAPITLVQVKVKLTDSFFGTLPVAGLQNITLINIGDGGFDNGGSDSPGGPIFLSESIEGSGIYEASVATASLVDGEIILQLKHNNRLYFSRTRYIPAVPIDTIEQGNNTFFGDDDTELIVTFTDDPNRSDFYLFDFDFDEFLVTDDQFYQGQEFSFSYFYEGGIAPGKEVEISLMGIDQQLFNYMGQIIDQSERGFGPFDTPAATVRGNIFDVNDLDNIDVFDNVNQPNIFPLGYFAIVQRFTKKIIVN